MCFATCQQVLSRTQGVIASALAGITVAAPIVLALIVCACIASVAATMRLRMSLTELQSHPAMLVTSTRAPLEPLPCERCELATSRSWLVGVVGIGSASALPVQS